MATSTADLLLRIDATTEGLRRELARAEGAVKGSTEAIDKNTKTIDKTFSAATAKAMAFAKQLIGLAAAYASLRTVKAAIDDLRQFETALAEVSTLLDGVDQMPRIAEEARRLSREFGGSATDQARAFYQAISAGAGSAAEATELLEAANRLAIGGVTDITTAVSGLTAIINAWGLETSDATRVSDAMFVAMRAGQTTIGELSASIGQVAAIASTAGVSFEETLAAVSALTLGGVSTSQAFTQLSGVMVAVIKPTEGAKKVAKELGIEFDLAAIQARGLQNWLAHVTEKAGGSQQVLTQLFGRVEGLSGVLALAGNQAQTFTGILADMAKRAPETQMAFDKMAQTFDFKMSILKAQFADTGKSFATLMMRFSDPALGFLIKHFDTIIGLIEATIKSLTVITAIYAGKFLLSMNAATLAQAKLNLAVLANPYVAAAAALTALIYAVDKFIKSQSDAVVTAHALTTANNRQTEATRAYITQLDRLDPISAMMNQRYAENEAALQAVADEAAQAATQTAGLVRETKLLVNIFDLATPTTETNKKAVDGLIGSLSTVRLTYDDNIAAMNRSKFVMQGVTADTITQQKAVDAWTAAAKNGAAERAKAEAEAAQRQREAWTRTHEYLTNAFIDIYDNGKNAFKQIGDAFVAMIKRMVAEWAASKLMELVGFGNGGVQNPFQQIAGSPLGQLFGGGKGGSTAGNIAGSAASSGITSAMTAGMAGGGGLTGAIVGNGTAGSGLVGAAGTAWGSIQAGLAAIPGWGWALGAAALAAHLFSSKATPSSNAGMLVAPTPGAPADRTFAVDPFASGFQPLGFARREDQSEALSIISAFAAIDAALTEAIRMAGGTIDMSRATLSGYNEKGQGDGTFMGIASESGKGVTSVDMAIQLAKYASDVMRHAHGLTEEQKASIMGGVDGSHRSGLNRVPFDGYRAMLHKNEEVLTANDPRNQNNQADMSSRDMISMLKAIAVHTAKTARQLERWEFDGLPEERIFA
jgi:TP901 family phage tail tape measure protein